MAKQLRCEVCGESDFNITEGFYYCKECGTQQKQIMDLKVEVEEFDADGHRKNVSTMKIKTTDSEKVELSTWECYNYILRGLVDELLNLGAKEELKTITLQLWAAFLRHQEVAFFSKNLPKLPRMGVGFSERDAKILYNHEMRKKRAKKAKKATSKSSARSSATSFREWNRQKRKFAASEYESSKSEMTQTSMATTSMSEMSSGATGHKVCLEFNMRAKKFFKKRISKKEVLKQAQNDNDESTSSKRKFTIKDLNSKDSADLLRRGTVYAILCLALNLIEDDIQVSDMLRFMREGHLTTKRISKFFPDNIVSSCAEAIKSIKFFNGIEVYSDISMRVKEMNICKQIYLTQLVLPDIQKLAIRYCIDLALPEEFASYIERIIKIHPPEMKIGSTMKKAPNYEARAMAYIIFILKLLFGLDGHKEKIISKSASNLNLELRKLDVGTKLFVWQDWVRYIEMRKIILCQCHLPTSIQFKEDLSAEQYLEHVREEVEEFKIDNVQVIGDQKGIKQKKFMNVERIFETLHAHIEGVENTSNTNLKKFAPSMTPNHSYFQSILRNGSANVHIPNFMNEDFTQTTVAPFLKSKKLEKDLLSHSVKLNVEQIASTNDVNIVGVLRHPNRLISTNLVKVAKPDFNITETKWLTSILIQKQMISSSILVHVDKVKRVKRVPDSSYNGSVEFSNPTFKDLPGPRRNLEQESLFAEMSDDEIESPDEFLIKTDFECSLDLAVSNLDYWTLVAKTLKFGHIQFSKMRTYLPSTFLWLLDYCANMIGVEWYELYEQLMIIEAHFVFLMEPLENLKNMVVFRNNLGDQDIQSCVDTFKRCW